MAAEKGEAQAQQGIPAEAGGDRLLGGSPSSVAINCVHVPLVRNHGLTSSLPTRPMITSLPQCEEAQCSRVPTGRAGAGASAHSPSKSMPPSQPAPNRQPLPAHAKTKPTSPAGHHLPVKHHAQRCHVSKQHSSYWTRTRRASQPMASKCREPS